jgi:hypothetical protein
MIENKGAWTNFVHFNKSTFKASKCIGILAGAVLCSVHAFGADAIAPVSTAPASATCDPYKN